jgi:hypothetical protein
MQTPKHWYLIGRSMATSALVLSPHSILPRSIVSLRFHSLMGKTKTDVTFKNVFLSFFLIFKKSCLELPRCTVLKSWSECAGVVSVQVL